ncbi:MAG: threonine aldolase [Opitutaceae bacterium]|nr:threonine aldolase [Opitutaceae bacterium]MBP9913402.1 threonine aldolase [Opitutaceae bacterium]
MTAAARDDYTFASDNTAGICPEALAALNAANSGRLPSYGADALTAQTQTLMREVFETDCEVFLVFNGTAANALALSAVTRSYQSILCHQFAHLDTDECGAAEFFSGGTKIITLPGTPDAKLLPGEIAAAMSRAHGVGIHYPRPAVLSLTQATEFGTLYPPAEISALSAAARHHGLAVHMDGARFANAAAALAAHGHRPADLTWRAGVDVLSFGGTKNGLHTTEAVVFFNRPLARDFAFRVKQAGQLASKTRFAAAQWVAVLRDGAWLRHAAHANTMAQRLATGLRGLPGGRLLFPVEANGVFIELPPALAAKLMAQGWHFYKFVGEHGYRLMCSWQTQPAEVDAFIAAAQATAHAP